MEKQKILLRSYDTKLPNKTESYVATAGLKTLKTTLTFLLKSQNVWNDKKYETFFQF